MALTVDTRTATEYGVVRTFGQVNFQFTHPGQQHGHPASFTGSPTTARQSTLLGQPGDGYAANEYLFLQFAGFHFGKSASAYGPRPGRVSPATSRRPCSAVASR